MITETPQFDDGASSSGALNSLTEKNVRQVWVFELYHFFKLSRSLSTTGPVGYSPL